MLKEFLNPQMLIFVGIFLLVFILFLSDFKFTSPKSWLILFGITSLGIIIGSNQIKRRKFMKELKERENALKELEDKFKELKEESIITEDKYEKAKAALEVEKAKAKEIEDKANEDFETKKKEIKKQFDEFDTKELMEEIHKILSS